MTESLHLLSPPQFDGAEGKVAVTTQKVTHSKVVTSFVAVCLPVCFCVFSSIPPVSFSHSVTKTEKETEEPKTIALRVHGKGINTFAQVRPLAVLPTRLHPLISLFALLFCIGVTCQWLSSSVTLVPLSQSKTLPVSNWDSTNEVIRLALQQFGIIVSEQTTSRVTLWVASLLPLLFLLLFLLLLLNIEASQNKTLMIQSPKCQFISSTNTKLHHNEHIYCILFSGQKTSSEMVLFYSILFCFIFHYLFISYFSVVLYFDRET